MSILLGVIVVFALLTLAVAIRQAATIVWLAPAHENLAGFMPLGWWKFRQLEQKAGPAAAQPLSIYKRAVVAFVIFLLLGLGLSGWAMKRAPASPDAAVLIVPDATSSELAFNIDLRRVATLPGALILES